MNSVSRTNEVVVGLDNIESNTEQTIRLMMTYSDCDAMAVAEVYAEADEKGIEGWDKDLLEEVKDFACRTENVQVFMMDDVVHLSARLVDDTWVIEFGKFFLEEPAIKGSDIKSDEFYRRYAHTCIDLDSEHQLDDDALIVHGDDGYWVAVMHYVRYPVEEQ